MAQPELNRLLGRSGVFAGEADIYNSNEYFRSVDRCLFNPTIPPVTNERSMYI
ncbi:hypothetical protein [Microcoleus sp. B4-D4]|uniref:hypothetical protein n=1 Tax=Microcoleus sp. B4-D4 TaxID=2818667 RepID=UPI002FD1884B